MKNSQNNKMMDQTGSDILHAFLEKANKGHWDGMHDYVQPMIIYNGDPEYRGELIRRITERTKRGDVKLRLDGLTSDEAANGVAGRLVTTVKNSDGNTFEVWDMIMVFVKGGKISHFYQIQSEISRHVRESTVPAFITKSSKNPSSVPELKQAYMRYNHDLNMRCVHNNVADHFAEEVLVEGRTLGIEQTRAFFVDLIQPATVGLKYVVEGMVVDVEKQQLAAKLSIQGVPENKRVQEHFGGGDVNVVEIAMYGFTDGKISVFCGAPPKGLLPESLAR